MIRGTRGRIGFLWPADGLNDDEYWSCLPEGVALLTARYAVAGGLSVAELEADSEFAPILEATHLIRLAHADVAALGDCAGSFVRGVEHERALTGAIEVKLGKPATTMSRAIVGALNALSAKRIALVAPYAAPVVDRFVAFLNAHKIEVVHRRELNLHDEIEIADVTSDRWRAIAYEANVPAADSIVLGGGGIRAAAFLDMVEADLGKPVVAGPAALIWCACRLMCVDATQSGRGRLFSDCGTVTVPR